MTQLISPALIAGFFAVSGFAGGWVLNGYRLQSQIISIKNAELDKGVDLRRQLANEAARNAVIATELQKLQNARANTVNEIIKTKVVYVKANPLPTDCRLDSERLRQLSAAASAANAAR